MPKKNKKKYLIGIDIGGTKLLTALFRRDFKLIAKTKEKVETAKGRKYFLDSIVQSVEDILEENGLKSSQLAAVGIGCPGIIDPKSGRVLISPNIPFLKKFPLKEKLKHLLGLPVVIENDANTGLYGEFHFGAGKDYSNIIGVFLGTGIGGALILEGKLYHGASKAAGEIGHTIVNPSGPLCGCGQHGCLEAFAGRIAIASEAAVLAAKQQAPNLYKEAGTEISKIKSGVLAKAIAAGDKAILQLIKEKSALLGITLANLVNFLSPERIILGGGMVEALGKIIVPEAERSMRQYAMPGISKHVRVVQAKLQDDAIVYGAAKMAAEAAFKD